MPWWPVPIHQSCVGPSEVKLSNSRSAIRIAGLRFAYPSPLPDGDPIPALRGVSLEVADGEFFALMGPVGAGKSTLCYALNGAIPHVVDGEMGGEVSVYGQSTVEVPMGRLAMQVGLVFEDAEVQLFNATVADEVAFGPEGMGLPVAEVERRVDESLALVGLSGMRDRPPRTLSGGEQKRLALASVLAMHPRVLVLDEPTSGLDPRARKAVLLAIDRLRQERGREMTVVMASQDADAVVSFASRMAVLWQGQAAFVGAPEKALAGGGRVGRWGLDVPQLALLAHRLGRGKPFVSVPEAVEALRDLPVPDVGDGEGCAERQGAPPLIVIRDLAYRYPGAEGWALRDLNLEVAEGEWLAIVGVNGSGKSTLVRHLNGLLKPARGVVRVGGMDTRQKQVGELARLVGYLPQNPDRMLFSATVREEVAYGPCRLGLRGKELDRRVVETLELLELLPLADYPPAVLGYGLRRRVALACVLAMRTPVLVLDEPAVGLDREGVSRLMRILARRHREGTTVVLVTHDLRLAARHAQRVVVLRGGRLAAVGSPGRVLADVEALRESGLEPLPVTALAQALGWPPPWPVTVDGFAARLGRG